MVDLLDEGREAGEHEVEVPVAERDVERRDDADGREKEHLEGADDAPDEVVLWEQALVELRTQVHIPGLPPQPPGLPLEQDGGVGLGREDEEGDGDETREAGEDPEDPAPAQRLGDVAAHDGTDDGAEEGTDGEGGHGGAALLLVDHVGDGAAAVGERHGAEEAGEEAEADEGGERGGHGAGDGEGEEAEIGGVVDDAAAVDLGEGREDHGAGGEAEDVDADDEGAE